MKMGFFLMKCNFYHKNKNLEKNGEIDKLK